MNIHFNIPLFRQGKRETHVIQARRIARNDRQAFEFALARAQHFFQHHYPQWDQYLFDEPFINSRAASLLAGSLRKGEGLDATLLVEAWAAQILWDSEELRQRHSAQLLPAACRFVHRFQIELRTLVPPHASLTNYSVMPSISANHTSLSSQGRKRRM